MGFGVWGLRFGVYGCGSEVQGLGSRVQFGLRSFHEYGTRYTQIHYILLTFISPEKRLVISTSGCGSYHDSRQPDPTNPPPSGHVCHNHFFRGFPKLRGSLRGPHNKDYSILWSILRSPYFGKLPFRGLLY